MPLLTILVLALVALNIAVWAAKHVVLPQWARWRAARGHVRLAALAVLLVSTLIGSDKGVVNVTRMFRFLFWDPQQPWHLAGVQEALTIASSGNETAEADLELVEAVTSSNEVWTLSFDWHAPDRLPPHDAQNVMAWTCAVVPTNINGTLYEDHYVAFNGFASTNPAVILIEYARRTDAGGIERYSSEVVTNSYPATSVVELQSGSHTCYWFRCPVPQPFVNEVRDWNGEALFGSPAGSGRGFDLLGTLVVDDGDAVWVGATTNIVLESVESVFKNGVNITNGGEG